MVEIMAASTIHGDMGIELHALRFLAEKLKVNLICFVGIEP